jgi:hypothetical protein
VELDESTNAAGIVANIVAVLATLTVGGEPVFKRVDEFENVDAFLERARSDDGAAAGVIARPAEYGAGTDNAAQNNFRLPLEIAVRFLVNRKAGQGDATAAGGLRRYASLITRALLTDRSRGGNAHRVEFEGRLLDGTAFPNPPRLDTKRANAAFHVAIIPAECAWEVV